MKDKPESLKNIGFLCPQHSRKPDPRFQKIPLKKFIGKFVKLAFPVTNGRARQENMWVKVTCLADNKGEELRGILNNDPIFADCKCGDMFEFKRSEIIEAIDL